MKPSPTSPPDFTTALQVAGRLTTDAFGRTVPDPKLRQELRDRKPPGEAEWAGSAWASRGIKPPLDEAQKARVRELRAQGMPLLHIAQLMGTSYARVQRVDGTSNGERCPKRINR